MRAPLGVLVSALLVVMAIGVPAQATIIWDASPLTTGAPVCCDLENRSDRRNYAEEVSFAGGATLTGIDIYSLDPFGDVGDPVRVRIWDDAGGVPGTLLLNFATSITIEDLEGTDGSGLRKREHADFAFVLAPGATYWIGMSGDSGDAVELALMGLSNVDDNSMAVFDGLLGGGKSDGVGDMAFRLHGEAGPAPVPEPGTLILVALGLGGVAVQRRRS